MKKLINKIVTTGTLAVMCVSVLGGCNKKLDANFTYKASDYITIGQYENVEVEVEAPEVTDAEVEAAIQQVIKENVDYVVVDRPVQAGDMVVINLYGNISGKQIDGLSFENYELLITDSSFYISEFPERLIGLSAGDSRAISDLKVPEDFTNATQYAGKSIVYNVQVLEVREPSYSELTDEFVQTVSETCNTVSEYETYIRTQLEAAENERYENDKYQAALDYIFNNTTVNSLPEDYVAERTESISKAIAFYAPYYSMTEEEYTKKYYGTDTVEEYARKVVTQELIYQAIVEAENFTVDTKYYDAHILEIVEQKGYTTVDALEEKYGKDTIVRYMLFDMAEQLIKDSIIVK